jgi:lipopolysaccharide transport protein LptA
MRHPYKWRVNFLFLLNLMIILLVWGQPVFAQNKSTVSPSSDLTQMHKNQPIHFSSYTFIETGPKGKEVLTLGKWPNKQVEIFLEKDSTTINADTVWYYSADSIFKAVGHIKIVKVDPQKGNLVAISKKAEFDQGKNQVTLNENAKVTQGQNEISGNVIVITQSEEGSTMEVEDATGVLYPQTKPDTSK